MMLLDFTWFNGGSVVVQLWFSRVFKVFYDSVGFYVVQLWSNCGSVVVQFCF